MQRRPDVLCMTEHWLPHDGLGNMGFMDYSVTAAFCRSTGRHGGVVIYTRECIDAQGIISVSALSSERHFEIAGVVMTLGQERLTVLTAYRSPNGDVQVFMDGLCSALVMAADLGRRVILCGDFNVDALRDTMEKRSLFDVFESFGLSMKINEPTRIQTNRHGMTTRSCIDFMVSNIEEYGVSVVDLSLSDHLALMLKCRGSLGEPLSIINDNKDPSIIKYKFSNRNLDLFRYHLGAADWSELYNSSCIDGRFRQLMLILSGCLEVSCRVSSANYSGYRCKGPDKTWITDEIKSKSQDLKNLFWLLKNTNTYENNQIYKENKKQYRKLLIRAKQIYFEKRICNAHNKTSASWKIVNKILGRTKSGAPHEIKLIRHNGGVITQEKEISDAFAEYFTTVAEDKLRRHYGGHLSDRCTVTEHGCLSVFLRPVTEAEMYKIILNLKNKKSTCTDNIPASAIKHASDILVPHLTYLANESLVNGKFPAILKCAKIVPVYKKGDTEDMQNYRPISILSVISKILEKVMYARISNFVEANSLLSDSQHGFRTGRSTESACFELTNYLHAMMDRRRYVAGLFFDLSRAFDSVDLKFVREKLHRLGIRGVALGWMMSFLMDRSVVVRQGSSVSGPHRVGVGVAQGSVMGPLIFLLYVNDLSRAISDGLLVNFADDTTIIVTSETQELLIEKITSAMQEFEKWCFANKLILNSSKTVCVLFSRKYMSREVVQDFQNLNIIVDASARFLGLHVDEALSWEQHVQQVCGRLNSAYFALLNLRQKVGELCLIDVYYAMVYSHIAYCVIAWGQTTGWERVFKTQKRIVRIIFNLSYRESCRDYFIRHNLMTFPCIYIYKCALFVKNNLSKFSTLTNGVYNTRSHTTLLYQSHRTARYEKSSLYSCQKIYNKLPKDIRDVENEKHFKNGLKNWLIDTCYYSLAEFYDQ